MELGKTLHDQYATIIFIVMLLKIMDLAQLHNKLPNGRLLLDPCKWLILNGDQGRD